MANAKALFSSIDSSFFLCFISLPYSIKINQNKQTKNSTPGNKNGKFHLKEGMIGRNMQKTHVVSLEYTTHLVVTIKMTSKQYAIHCYRMEEAVILISEMNCVV